MQTRLLTDFEFHKHSIHHSNFNSHYSHFTFHIQTNSKSNQTQQKTEKNTRTTTQTTRQLHPLLLRRIHTTPSKPQTKNRSQATSPRPRRSRTRTQTHWRHWIGRRNFGRDRFRSRTLYGRYGRSPIAFPGESPCGWV